MYQMNTDPETVERNYSLTFIVVGYQNDHPQTSTMCSNWYYALQWNFSSIVKTKK